MLNTFLNTFVALGAYYYPTRCYMQFERHLRCFSGIHHTAQNEILAPVSGLLRLGILGN